MTLPAVYRIWRYWRNHPPTHMLAAAFMGFKPKSEAGEDAAGFAAFMQAFGGAGGKVEVMKHA